MGIFLQKLETNASFQEKLPKIALTLLCDSANSCKCSLVAEYPKCDHVTVGGWWPVELQNWIVNSSGWSVIP